VMLQPLAPGFRRDPPRCPVMRSSRSRCTDGRAEGKDHPDLAAVRASRIIGRSRPSLRNDRIPGGPRNSAGES
jgi:hypothetical protein